MTRDEALARGSTTYQGEPCVKGHNGKRYTSSYNCWECTRRRVGKQRHPATHHKPTIKPAQSKPLPSPHVIQSDWMKPPTKAQLMGRR